MTNVVRSPGRNQPCSCGSGKRFKDCCGRLGAQPPAVPDIAGMMNAALAAQRERRLDEAEERYREVLAHQPDQPDTLHMLGVIRFEKDDYRGALLLILRALELTRWAYRSYRHNLGLALARANRARDDAVLPAARERYRIWREKPPTVAASSAARISVVVPCHNHARYIAPALQSVYAQSHRNVELIVIDDGSSDDSAECADRILRNSPFPHRLIVRENRGAAATINEGIGLSSGDYVNLLNSDDLFTPDRLSAMREAIADKGLAWGFANVSCIDETGCDVDTLQNARAYALSCATWAVPFRETVGFALLTDNVAISSGNLFFARPFVDQVGGFRDFRYNHDWDFCLRALKLEEPVFVERQTYRYRLHGANTISESTLASREEANRVLEEYCAWGLDADARRSLLAPSLANWGTRFTTTMLESGMAEVMDSSFLRMLAHEALESAPSSLVVDVGS